MGFRQIDCFKVHLAFFKALGIWPSDNPSLAYKIYSKIFISLFLIIFIGLYTINFYFLPQQLETFIEEMIFYFTDVSVLSKALAFIYRRDKIKEMLAMLESDIFQSDNPEEKKIINKAKKTAKLYWKFNATLSILANLTNVYSPFFTHLIFSTDLDFPVCSYSFIPESYKNITLYPTYFYQSTGITSHMFYNINVDTFLLGVIFLALAQLDILNRKLRKVTDICQSGNTARGENDKDVDEQNTVLEINKCIKHYCAVWKYSKLIQESFSETLFVQFGVGSFLICICLFRFTLFATKQYYIFLFFYMILMILQIMVPCWFGSQIMEKSSKITFAVYDCDWTPRCRRFKTNLQLLVEIANRPLTITGGKMFQLSLGTFTSIMNSAYSFFTLLRHMQSR